MNFTIEVCNIGPFIQLIKERPYNITNSLYLHNLCFFNSTMAILFYTALGCFHAGENEDKFINNFKKE